MSIMPMFKTFQLVGRYDIVVNCSGIGSRELLNDEKVYPVRGQVMRVTAPWIKYYSCDDKSTYIYPNSDSVVIGGTHQDNNFSTAVDPEDTMDIAKRVGDFLPSIKGYEMQSVCVGLRPARSPFRVEKETMHLANGPLHVVHNYGHGANGVALSWGTAIYAAGLVEETIQDAAVMKSKL